ncbi:checkpoint protein Hus1/Mec3 [Pisolithus sp. B1]|nr:checkpoint protein Hus1/Mec3 [Pisolithus sp. B1]
MRFRATVENVAIFCRIIQAVEKLQRKCIIKFTENEMHIICNDDANEGGIQVWSVVKVDSIFTNYRIQSNANNQITAASSILPAYDADELVMKLAKKNDQAVLSFEMFGVSRSGRKVRVTHDVRIEVEKLREPLCPEPDVHILLPPLQKLRTIVERLRPLSDVLALRANNSGKLQMAISTDSVKVETQWIGCANPSLTEPTEKPDPETVFSVLVSVRSFLKFLNSHVVSTTTIACICQKHCAILYVYIGEVADAGGVLTFYIPSVIED